MKKRFNIGKREGSMGINNDFWIKKFENGVKLRKKGEGEITLGVYEVFEMLLNLRKFGKRNACPILLHSIDMTYVWQKYPETKEFVEKLLMDEVSDKEKLKIHEEYMTKIHILERLEEDKK